MSSSKPFTYAVMEPFPIFKLAHRFVLYDPETISYARERHNICGVLIGGLAQAPQQNIFLGVPLELMPEEARILVEKGVAFIEDDTRAHKNGFLSKEDSASGAASQCLGVDERRAYQNALRKQGQMAAIQASRKNEDRRRAALNKLNAGSSDWNDIPDDMLRPNSVSRSRSASRGPKRKARAVCQAGPTGSNASTPSAYEGDLLFESSSTPITDLPTNAPYASKVDLTSDVEPYAVTPTTSYPPLALPGTQLGPCFNSSTRHGSEQEILADSSPSYPLFKHLHSRGYFLAPGLRFGCQYLAYPGDPLRFHSHFLCNGMDWDEEFELLKLVGGGRLGTGVKKGFLVGGRNQDRQEEVSNNSDLTMRTLCIEWGGM